MLFEVGTDSGGWFQLVPDWRFFPATGCGKAAPSWAKKEQCNTADALEELQEGFWCKEENIYKIKMTHVSLRFLLCDGNAKECVHLFFFFKKPFEMCVKFTYWRVNKYWSENPPFLRPCAPLSAWPLHSLKQLSKCLRTEKLLQFHLDWSFIAF